MVSTKYMVQKTIATGCGTAFPHSCIRLLLPLFCSYHSLFSSMETGSCSPSTLFCRSKHLYLSVSFRCAQFLDFLYFSCSFFCYTHSFQTGRQNYGTRLRALYSHPYSGSYSAIFSRSISIISRTSLLFMEVLLILCFSCSGCISAWTFYLPAP